MSDQEKPTAPPVILATRSLAQTRIFHVQEVNLRFANGNEAQFERLVAGGQSAVLIVPILDPDTLLLVREYATGVERYELAFPKGRVEAGEDPLEAANRELMEEVGYGAKRLEVLRQMTLAPAYSGFTTHIILARGLYEHRLPGDEPESIETVPWALECCDELLGRDDFTEARSIAALFLTREHLQRERG